MTDQENINVLGLHVIQKLKDSLPVDDIMAWLITEYPELALPQLLKLLNVIYQEGFHISPSSEERRVYRVADRELTASPQRVEKKV